MASDHQCLLLHLLHRSNRAATIAAITIAVGATMGIEEVEAVEVDMDAVATKLCSTQEMPSL